MYKNFIGVDVGKYKLDIYNSFNEKTTTIENSREEVEKFVKTIRQKKTLVVIDLTGGYEQVAVDCFFDKGFDVIRAEGLKVKNFSKCTKYHRAKTDRKDAEILADYGRKHFKELELYKRRSENREKITKLYSRVEDLKRIVQQERNRSKQPNLDEMVRISIENLLEILKREIEMLKLEIKRIIEGDIELHRTYELLLRQKGIAEELGLFFLIKIERLGKIKRKQLTAFCGLAPAVVESGTIKKRSFLNGGRVEIKSKLFQWISILLKCGDIEITEKYRQMRENGKAHRLTMLALARKKINYLNAVA